LQCGHTNRYMHRHSLAQAEPLLYGEIKVPYNKSHINF